MNCKEEDPLAIYVFSYNRGEFLENCLRSIEVCASKFPVYLIDDNSDDKTTLDVINSHESKLTKLRPQTDSSEFKTGGLYANMRYALKHARENGISLALFVQDDMQLVRRIGLPDIDHALNYFEAQTNSAQLQTCFMKRYFSALDAKYTVINDSKTAYIRSRPMKGGFSGFSAVGLFHVLKFYELYGDLKQGEHNNNVYAERHGIKMGFSTFPFMMWLPFPISYRGKSRSVALQLVESIGGCGFYPYRIFSEEERKTFLHRDLATFPVAEDWLEPRNMTSEKTWSFTGGLSNLRARSGIRHYMAKMLDWMRGYH